MILSHNYQHSGFKEQSINISFELTNIILFLQLIPNQMGNTTCCGDNENQLQIQVGQQESIHEARFFHLYSQAKKTIKSLIFPKPLLAIDKSLAKKFEGEGVFLGRISRIRNGVGIMIYEQEGLYYIGSWVNNYRQGLGYMIYSDGSYYQGEWYQNQPYGYGHYYNPQGTWIFKGKWKAGVKQGQGQEIFPDGTIFKGIFSNGLKEGDGMLIFPNECKYDDRDQEKPNLRVSLNGTNGTGKLRCCFKGTFKADVASGYGVQKGQNYKYEGNWQNNQMHGAGKSTYYDENGNPVQFYIGQFKNGLKDGYGEYRWSDGRIYKGEWHEGEMTSKGVFIDRRE